MSKESNVRLAMLALMSQGYVIKGNTNDDAIVTMEAVMAGASVYKIATGEDISSWVFNEDTILLADDVSIQGSTIPKLFESTSTRLVDCTISSFNGSGQYENCTFTNPKEASIALESKLVSNCIVIKGDGYDHDVMLSLHVELDGTCKVVGFITVAGVNYHSLSTFDPVSIWVNLTDGGVVHDSVLSNAFDEVYRRDNTVSKQAENAGVTKC